MRYKSPLNGALSFNKAYIFFEDNVQHVLVNSVVSTSPAPVFSVLDQRLRVGDIYVGSDSVTSGNYSFVGSLCHAGTGYVFPIAQCTQVSVDAETKTGNWAEIGISQQPLSTKDMFAAWIVHNPANLTLPIEYSIFPATENKYEFASKAARCTPQTVANTGIVSAAVDSTHRTLAAAFWQPQGGTVYVPHMGLTINVDKPLTLVMKLTETDNLSGELSVADPTHENTAAIIRIASIAKRHRRNECIGDHCLHVRRNYGAPKEVTLTVELPTGGDAGSTVTQSFSG
ncbi:polysaccharide lyase family 8 protein [Ceratobasidium sp. AG-Ba]|nr:polysaccharide lyase family 8 protein [Ceratobasidium sp. AG-Ba]QRW05694.1 polysaccharide lyase family 8 protein [Ceratobasidium sp. AG-Ba]